MRIVDLRLENTELVQQAAALLVTGFEEHWPGAWPDQESALEEVHDMAQPDKICRAALGDEGQVIGWIGGQDYGYDGHIWELHPLVVHPEYRGQGIGRALVRDLEALLHTRGVITLILGSDDVDNMTSLANVDLYDKTWDRIREIQNFKGHPYSFYQKLGYKIVGVFPDANGPGQPDILLARRITDPVPGEKS